MFNKGFNPIVDLGAELVLIISIVVFLYFLAKVLSSIKIGSRIIRIPKVITIIFSSFILGIIIREISPSFSFELTPYLSTISVIILFLSFGAMIDFRSLKKIGIWVALIGTIPYLIEVIGLTIVVSLFTKLHWYEASIASTLIATCSVGITSPRLIENLSKGYEKNTQLNETLSLASAIESILSLVLFVIFIIFYKMGWSKDGITGTSSAIAIFGIAPIILISGFIIGILLGLFILFIVSPIMSKIIPQYKILTNDLEGEELEQANIINEKSRKRTQLSSLIITVLMLIIIYFALQTIALGFIMMESSLVAGMVLSIAGSKSIEHEEIQKSFAKNSGLFYGVVGSIIVWGFGGILIDPSSFAGSTWGNTELIPNIVYIILFTLIGGLFRFGGIFFIMSFSSKFTLKQKIYSFFAFYTKGTGGVNNGAAILLFIGVTETSGVKYEHAIIIREMLLGWGAFMVFLTIPVGDILLVLTRGKLIYKWNNLSEGEFKKTISTSLSDVSKTEEKELKRNTSMYWKSYYSKEKQEISISKEVNKNNKNVSRLINYNKNKINNILLKNLEIENKIIKYEKSQNRNIKYLENSISDQKDKLDSKKKKNELSISKNKTKWLEIIEHNKDKIKPLEVKIKSLEKNILPEVNFSKENNDLKIKKYNMFLIEFNNQKSTLISLIEKNISNEKNRKTLISSIN